MSNTQKWLIARGAFYIGALHGINSQDVGTRRFAVLKASANLAIVATDLAASGIHVEGISLVVQVDVPQDHKDHLHQSGRKIRTGESAAVVTLTTSK
jgi:superfamily II DNA/RNA helicase